MCPVNLVRYGTATIPWFSCSTCFWFPLCCVLSSMNLHSVGFLKSQRDRYPPPPDQVFFVTGYEFALHANPFIIVLIKVLCFTFTYVCMGILELKTTLYHLGLSINCFKLIWSSYYFKFTLLFFALCFTVISVPVYYSRLGRGDVSDFSMVLNWESST